MALSIPSPLGVCILPPPGPNAARTVSYGAYLHEILQHAGLPYTNVTLADLPAALPGLKLLLTVGERALPDPLAEQLRGWVGGGGGWVSVAGACGVPDLFGVAPEAPAFSSWGGGVCTLGEGYLQPEGPHPVTDHLRIPLHFFNGLPVRAAGAKVLARVMDAHQRPTPLETERAAVLEQRVGEGTCLLIAPDVPGSVVRIQQGRAITRDGVPAPDGTAPNCDEVLKTGDGGVLDWIFDREPVEGGEGLKGFLQPVADQWRELLLRSIFYLAERSRTPLPLLWLYPRNLPALGHLSHDTDGNEPDKARRLLEVLKEARVHSTWCTLLPGYDAKLTSEIRAAGHELGMHYDAMTAGLKWGEEQFERQFRELEKMFDGQAPVTNKNHYLRWEGDTGLLEWCGKRGFLMDQSRGATKSGEVGFNFGTCHPGFGVAPDGRTVEVFELPTLTQDLVVFAPEAVLHPLLDGAARQHGILHLLFHPAHIQKPGVAEALLHAVAAGRERGMEWWTGKQISRWELARRKVRWESYEQKGGGASISLTAGEELQKATLLWLLPTSAAVHLQGMEAKSQDVTRWGHRFKSVVLDLQPGKTHRFGLYRTE